MVFSNPRSRSAPRGGNSPIQEPLNQPSESTKVEVLLSALMKSFEESAMTKQGLLHQILQYRSSFVDQQEQFTQLTSSIVDQLAKISNKPLENALEA